MNGPNTALLNQTTTTDLSLISKSISIHGKNVLGSSTAAGTGKQKGAKGPVHN